MCRALRRSACSRLRRFCSSRERLARGALSGFSALLEALRLGLTLPLSSAARRAVS